LAATQPLPLSPPPFARQRLTEDDLTRRTPEAERFAREQFLKTNANGQFDPPSERGTVIFPGLDGGGEWGGAAFDPTTELLYVNSNEMAWILRLVERRRPTRTSNVKDLYVSECAACHKSDLSGSPPEFPSLLGLRARRNDSEVKTMIERGLG